VLAYRHSVSLPLIALVVVLCAIIGDSVGYEVGRHFGSRLLRHRIFDGRRRGIEKAQDLLRRRGGLAVFVARFTAFFRAVMPGLAGTSRMHYRRFLVWNAAGAAIWGVGFTMLGYLAGASYKRVESLAGTAGTVLFGVVVLVLIVVLFLRHRSQRREENESVADS
jgi:membrane-associated protein